MKTIKQLAIAAGQGDLDTMRTLLQVDASLAKDWQPLMDACFAGQLPAVELLLDHGADPNVVSKTNYRYRPLHRTIERKATFPRTEKHLAVVRLLLERGADPLLPGTYAGDNAVTVAAVGGDARFLPPLLERVGNLDLHTAAILGDLERVTVLLEQDPAAASCRDAGGHSALHYACRSRLGQNDPAVAARLEAVARLLMERGAPLDGCLDVAVGRNHAVLTELLLARGATIRDGDTLNHAACDGAHDALNVLARHGVDLNLTDGTEHHGGYIPFGCTLTMRSVQGAGWFLDQKLDPDYVGGKDGESSLHVAVRSGAGPALLKLLVDRGANSNARDAAGLTPLAVARAKARKSAIEYLVGIEADE